MRRNVTVFAPGRPEVPDALRCRLPMGLQQPIAAIGDPVHLEERLLAFFCSSSCPGNLILDTYDLARELRGAGVTVVGGFHSPMEKECLELLLRGAQAMIVCPARGIRKMRIPKPWREPLEAGRLLVLSPFADTNRRVTAELAARRNRFVAQLADEVFVAHAAAESKTEAFCRELLASGKPVLTIDRPENRLLLEQGVEPLGLDDVARRWPATPCRF